MREPNLNQIAPEECLRLASQDQKRTTDNVSNKNAHAIIPAIATHRSFHLRNLCRNSMCKLTNIQTGLRGFNFGKVYNFNLVTCSKSSGSWTWRGTELSFLANQDFCSQWMSCILYLSDSKIDGDKILLLITGSCRICRTWRILIIKIVAHRQGYVTLHLVTLRQWWCLYNESQMKHMHLQLFERKDSRLNLVPHYGFMQNMQEVKVAQ